MALKLRSTQDDLIRTYGQEGFQRQGKLLDSLGFPVELEQLAEKLIARGVPENVLFDALNDAATEAFPQTAAPESTAITNPPVEAPTPQPKELPADAAARLKQISTPGTPEFSRWQSGDKEIVAERDQLYNQMYGDHKIEIG